MRRPGRDAARGRRRVRGADLSRAAIALLALVFAGGGAPAAGSLPIADLAFAAPEGVFLAGSKPRLLVRGAAEPTWSPDGRRIAYVADGAAGANDVFVVDADGTHRGRITWTRGDETSPSWSPDGTRLAVERGGRIVILRADGSGARVLASGWDPAWSPGGAWIAFSNGDDLYAVLERGGRPRRLTKTAGADTAPAWSPDGRRLAFVAEDSGAPDIHVLELRSGRTTRLTADAALDGSPAFSADGRAVVFVSDRTGVERLWRIPAGGGIAGALVAAPTATDPAPRPRAEVVELLPDLEQRPPADLSIKSAVRRGRRHFLLGFDSATDNVGVGPVVLSARRPSRRVPSMRASQIVKLAGGGRRTYDGVGTLRYVRSATHSHWHLMAFQRYELRRASDSGVVRRDRKSGFCLADHWAHAPGYFANERPAPVFKGYCERGRPGALAVFQGTSVGYTDRYPSHFHGQNLDLAGLEAGEYILVHRANRSLLLRELRYENNAASLRIQLGWPRGAAAPPSIRVLRVCPTSDRC